MVKAPFYLIYIKIISPSEPIWALSLTPVPYITEIRAIVTFDSYPFLFGIGKW